MFEETLVKSAKEKLMKSLTKERCEKIIQETENLYKWIKESLLKN